MMIMDTGILSNLPVYVTKPRLLRIGSGLRLTFVDVVAMS